MNIAQILVLVAQLVPTAKTIIDTLYGAAGSAEPAVLDLIGKLTPAASALIERIQGIRTQTEAQHPEIWAAVSADWDATAAKWAELQARP